MILGTAQLGLDYGVSNKLGKPSLTSAIELLEFALIKGVRILDTAAAYGDSEKVIGNSGLSKKFQIISKLSKIGLKSSYIENIVCNSINKSLEKLKTDKLYAYLLHSIDDLNQFGDLIWEQFIELRRTNKTKKIGYSVYNPKQLETIYVKYKPDIIQLPMNILDREFQKAGWLKRFKEDKVEIHVRSVFLQGLLLMSSEEQIKMFPKHKNTWNAWNIFLKDNKVNAMEACLSFINQNNGIDELIIGVNNALELFEVLEASKIITPIFPLSCSDENLINPSHWLK